MFKVTRSIATCGFAEQIYLIGIWESGLARHEVMDEHRQIHRFRLLIPRVSGSVLFQLLRLAEYSIRTLLYSFGKQVNLVNCHMLMLLPACVLLKSVGSAQLVYEPREIETEQDDVTGRKRSFLKWVEKRLLRYVDVVVHVGRGCAKWYEETYDVKPVHVLNNVPYAGDAPPIAFTQVLREHFQISSTDLTFIFQGQFREERGIMLMLNVFAACPDKNKHIIFMGFGPHQGIVEEFADKYPNIHFLPAVPQARVLDYTSGADVGLCVLVGTSTNTRLMNPNKLNEYFMAGIPVIASNLPEPVRFVKERECGWIIEPDQQSLEALVARITRAEVQSFREHIKRVRPNYGWEQEEKTLVRIYNELWARRK